MTKSILHRIPGGWFGNEPGFHPQCPKLGNVTVDSARIIEAVDWLRRRARIIEASPHDTDGILLKYTVK